MGQLLGKARLRQAAESLVNLDQAAAYLLWEAFNDVAEGFGLNVEELIEIVSSLQNTTFAHASKQVILVAVESLFKALDTDRNNLVDSLEVLVTLCMLSGMELRDKAKFCFMCYDFDESGEITVDELTLLLKSCATGLSKLSLETDVPEEPKIEAVAHEAFRRTGKSNDVRITCDEFVEYCLTTPEVLSWTDFYDDAADYAAEAAFSAGAGSGVAIEEKRKAKVRSLYSANVPLQDAIYEEGTVKTRDHREGKARDPDCNKYAKPSKEQAEMEAKLGRPWLETVSMTVPTAAASAPAESINRTQPDENTLQLDWVHGYSAQSTRNSLRYTASGEIVYGAACVGVVYSPETHEQRFNLDHTDDILSVALHPEERLVATGERGNPPKICVWETSSSKLVVTLRGVHKVGVSALAFSPGSGKYLVSVGQDAEHTVALYDWEQRTLVFAARSSREMVMDVVFRWPSKETPGGVPPCFVTCGKDHIFFWNQDNNKRKKKGVYGKQGAPQTMLSLACHPKNNRIISGSLSGHLYVWDHNRNLQRTIKAHDSAVTCLYFHATNGLLSGSEDGKVRLWSPNLEQGATFDINGLGSLRPSLASVCYSSDANKILVGTRASEIYEMSSEDGSNLHPGPLVCGHYRGELHGLCVHPHKAEYCTVGDDQTVRIWDIETRRMVRMVKIDTRSRACAYSPDGSLIAIGLGAGGAGSKKDGAFVILNEADLCIVHEARDSKRWISEVKFSPDGATLAIASTDTSIYLYNVEDFASKGKCKGHHGHLRNVDFSEDNQCMQSDCSERELLFWNANTGEQYKKPSTMRDVEWASQNVPVGYATQGMWKVPGALDLVSCERSHSGSVVIGADVAGRVRAFRNPAVDGKSGFNEFRGHSSAVRRVRFMYDDSYLVTVGQDDRCVMQWKHEEDQAEELAEQSAEAIYRNDPDSEDESDFVDGNVLDRSIPQEFVNNRVELVSASVTVGSEEAGVRRDEFLDDTDEEEEKTAAATTSIGGPSDGLKAEAGAAAGGDKQPDRPWTRLVVPPSVLPKEDHSASEEGLALEWVHGYNAQSSRGSVQYLRTGELVYPAANLAVIYNKQGSGLQRFFTDHSDQVVSVALHPEGKLIATGQLGKEPKVIVWDMETMEAVRTLSGLHRRGVPVVKFSRSGTSILTVGMDDEHKIAVYDWKNGIVSVQCNGGADKVLDADFTPSGNGVVQVGVNHIKFHDLAGRNVITRKALLGKKGKLQAVYCVGWAGSRAVVGTADGHLYGFDGRLLQQSVKGHEKSVHTLYSCSEGLVSGGKDGWVKIWSTGLECKAQFDVGGTNKISIRSVCWDPDANRIAVGLRNCDVVEISASDGSDQNGNKPVVQGHSKNELWGLATHPSKAEFVTVGDDQILRVWDVASRKVIKSAKLDTAGRAVCYSSDGTKIAVGLGAKIGRGRQKKDGSFVVLNEKDLVMLHEGRNSKQWITDIKFSLDGATLALGSYDNAVYLYDIPGGYVLKGVFEGHNSFITHLDISSDGQFVMTNCGAFELKYCDANSGTNIPAISTLKDVLWSSWTCPLGWPVKGCHESSGAVVQAVHRSTSSTLTLSGDEFGRVDLRRYPCTQPYAGRKTYRGHTGCVRNARFTQGDTHAITVGEQDRCVMQWRIITSEEDVAVKAGDSGDDSDVVLESKAAGPGGLQGSGMGEFVAVRPWLSAVVPPTGAPSATQKGLDEPDTVDVELEFVYGHRSDDVRNNLRYNSVGQVVYFAASVGIIYDKATHSQQFYLGHDGRPIISLAMHGSGKFVATGEGSSANRRRASGNTRVHIWNALTGSGVIKLPAAHRSAASQLCFSTDGTRLISVGEDENHTINIWRSDSGCWADARLQATAGAGQEKVLFALFYGPGHICTGGVNHMNFWTLNGAVLTPVEGRFGRKGKKQPLLCAATVGQSQGDVSAAAALTAKIATGTVTGHLYLWGGDEVIKSVKAHERTVNAIHACHLGVITGSKDGVVKLWDTKLSPIRTFDMTEALPTPHRPPVRSVAWDGVRGLVLVGTQGSEIYELTTANQSCVLIGQGHAMDELHGLAAHPSNPNLFLTAGDDQTVRLWDASKRKMVAENNVGCMTRAVCWHPSGDHIGVGLGGSVGRGRQKKDGVMMVLNGETLELAHETRDSKEWIADAKYSPDGETLAIASYDNKIYLYSVNKNYELRAKCEGHNSFVQHIDFSEDSEYLRSNCGGFDLLFHKCEDGSVVNSPSVLKDVKWATTTCCLAWSVQGMWPEVTDETAYNACDVSQELDLLASVDSLGNLSFFNYPAITKGAKGFKLRAHVSQVTNVRFNSDRSCVFTTGGPDRAICQWRITKRAKPEALEPTAAAENAKDEKKSKD